MPRLSDSIFQGRSTDSLVVTDAYQISSGETRNSLFDAVKGIYSDAVTELYANPGSAVELVSLLAEIKRGSVDKLSMFDRSLGSMGSGLPGLLGSLGGALKTRLGSVANQMIGPEAEKALSVLYDNAELLIRTRDVGDATSLIDFLQDLTGNPEIAGIINIEAESAIIAGLAGQLIQYGLPQMLDEVLNQARSEEVRNNALAWISSSAVAGSDLDTTLKIIDTIGLTAFLANNPDAINQILGSYYLSSDDTPADYPARRDKLVLVLTRIDANWFQVKRNGVWVNTLAPFMSASSDARKILSLDDPFRTLILAATGRQAQTVSSVIKELYPNAWVTA